MSSTSYFQQLLELFPIKDFQQQLLLGLVSSTTSGTEDVCRAASNAFLSYMQLLDNDRRNDLAKAAASIILRQLDQNATQDDRQVVILLDFLCFLMDQNLLFNDSWDIWAIMQKIQGPTSSLQRIEAALNCYSRLLSIDEYRTRAMDKLTRQLLHRWPKVCLLFPHEILRLTYVRRFVTMLQICYTSNFRTARWLPLIGMHLSPKQNLSFLS